MCSRSLRISRCMYDLQAWRDLAAYDLPPCDIHVNLLHVLTDRCLTCWATAVFDGHGGAAAARFLNERLYQVYSDAIDDSMLNSTDECDMEGVMIVCRNGRHGSEVRTCVCVRLLPVLVGSMAGLTATQAAWTRRRVCVVPWGSTLC